MLEQPGRTIVSLRRSLLLALVAAPLPLVGDLAMELAMKKWLSSYPSPGSWLALFLAAGLYYYLVSPLSVAIAAAHTRRIFRVVLVSATYVYLVLYSVGFATYALSLGYGLGGALPYILVLLASVLSAWIGLATAYREKAREQEIPAGTHSRLQGLGAAFISLFLAWLVWGATIVAIYVGQLNTTIYESELFLYYRFLTPRLFEVSMVCPLARVTTATLVARITSILLLSYFLEPLRKPPFMEEVYGTYYPWEH